MRKVKALLAVVLCFAMVVSIIPFGAFAAESDPVVYEIKDLNSVLDKALKGAGTTPGFQNANTDISDALSKTPWSAQVRFGDTDWAEITHAFYDGNSRPVWSTSTGWWPGIEFSDPAASESGEVHLAPGVGNQVALIFNAPITGNYQIAPKAGANQISFAFDAVPTGNSVKFRIMHDNTKLWPTDKDYESVVKGSSLTFPTLAVDLKAGDTIRLEMSGAGTDIAEDWMTNTICHPQITLLTAVAEKPTVSDVIFSNVRNDQPYTNRLGRNISWTVSKDSDPKYGTVVIEESGEFTYTPKASAKGQASDTFTFKVTNAAGIASDAATVRLNLVDPPKEPIATYNYKDYFAEFMIQQMGTAQFPAVTNGNNGVAVSGNVVTLPSNYIVYHKTSDTAIEVIKTTASGSNVTFTTDNLADNYYMIDKSTWIQFDKSILKSPWAGAKKNDSVYTTNDTFCVNGWGWIFTGDNSGMYPSTQLSPGSNDGGFADAVMAVPNYASDAAAALQFTAPSTGFYRLNALADHPNFTTIFSATPAGGKFNIRITVDGEKIWPTNADYSQLTVGGSLAFPTLENVKLNMGSTLRIEISRGTLTAGDAQVLYYPQISLMEKQDLAPNSAKYDSVFSGNAFTEKLTCVNENNAPVEYKLVKTDDLNGTITLDSKTGEFTYISDEGYTGSSSFTFCLVNTTTKEETDTALISMEVINPITQLDPINDIRKPDYVASPDVPEEDAVVTGAITNNMLPISWAHIETVQKYGIAFFVQNASGTFEQIDNVVDIVPVEGENLIDGVMTYEHSLEGYDPEMEYTYQIFGYNDQNAIFLQFLPEKFKYDLEVIPGTPEEVRTTILQIPQYPEGYEDEGEYYEDGDVESADTSDVGVIPFAMAIIVSGSVIMLMRKGKKD